MCDSSLVAGIALDDALVEVQVSGAAVAGTHTICVEGTLGTETFFDEFTLTILGDNLAPTWDSSVSTQTVSAYEV